MPSSRNMALIGGRGPSLASSAVWDRRPAPVIISKVFCRVSNRYIALPSAISPSATFVIGRSSNLHRRDRLDLKKEIGVGEPAQDAKRAAGRIAGEIRRQDLARLRHVVGIADVDGDLGHVGDFYAACCERSRQILNDHFGPGIKLDRRKYIAVGLRRNLTSAEHELLRALGGNDMGVVGQRLREPVRIDARDFGHESQTLIFSSSTTRRTAGRSSMRSLKEE